MGWLWSSNSKPNEATAPDNTSSSPNTSSQAPVAPAASSQPKPPQSAEDAELQKFMDFFKAEEAAAASQNRQGQKHEPKPSPLPEWLTKMITPKDNPLMKEPDAPRRDPLSESLLPTDMSCRQAFDMAWGCNSVGGQWNAVYRYGEMRSCSEKWDDFWFCMRNKSSSGPVKDDLMRAHYRNKEHNKYYAPGKPSSEDVWEARTHKVEPGMAFSEGIEIPTMGDDEWRKMESERRQKIRDGLGFDKSE